MYVGKQIARYKAKKKLLLNIVHKYKLLSLIKNKNIQFK